MFENKRRDKEIDSLQHEVKCLNEKVWKLRQKYGQLLEHLGLDERYIKEEVIIVKKGAK